VCAPERGNCVPGRGAADHHEVRSRPDSDLSRSFLPRRAAASTVAALIASTGVEARLGQRSQPVRRPRAAGGTSLVEGSIPTRRTQHNGLAFARPFFSSPSGRVHLGVVGVPPVKAAHRKKLGLAIDHYANQAVMLPGGVGDRAPPVGGGVVDVGIRPGYDIQLAAQGGPNSPAGPARAPAPQVRDLPLWPLRAPDVAGAPGGARKLFRAP
jgi:hypothetical protein